MRTRRVQSVKLTRILAFATLPLFFGTPLCGQGRPQSWQGLFFLSGGVAAEWQHCDACPGNYPNPLWGPLVRVAAGATNQRFAVSESLTAWWQVLPVTVESRSSHYRSQYLMTELWYSVEPDDVIKVMIGAGLGRHRSSFGDDGHGGAIEAGVDFRLIGSRGAELRWQGNVIKSLTGTHEPFQPASLPAGNYRPLVLGTSLTLWTW